MRALFIIDSLEKLYVKLDSTLYLLKEFLRRGHKNRVADVKDIFATPAGVLARTSEVRLKDFSKTSDPFSEGRRYFYADPQIQNLKDFDLILIRKEPPFNMNYVFLTYLLERLPQSVKISNRPEGIRNTNEKLACLLFPKWAPRSVVTSQVERILEFQKKIQKDIVIKPLDNRSGIGVLRLTQRQKNAHAVLLKATHGQRRTLLAQEFLGQRPPYRDKRITLLDGKILFTYEKRSTKNDFRTNLSCGGIASRSKVSATEQKLLQDIRPYLKAQGIHMVGLDILQDKLIDFNVTCPGGVWDAKFLYPELSLVEAWADFLERLASA